jgi:hypothetical protein
VTSSRNKVAPPKIAADDNHWHRPERSTSLCLRGVARVVASSVPAAVLQRLGCLAAPAPRPAHSAAACVTGQRLVPASNNAWSNSSSPVASSRAATATSASRGAPWRPYPSGDSASPLDSRASSSLLFHHVQLFEKSLVAKDAGPSHDKSPRSGRGNRHTRNQGRPGDKGFLVCSNCKQNLEQNIVPKFAIANNFTFGPSPSYSTDLTEAELAIYYCRPVERLVTATPTLEAAI